MHRLLLATALLLSMIDTTLGQNSGLSQTVEGVTIYLGVIPSEIVRGYPRGHEESTMHDSPPGGTGYRHIVVALFDAVTKQRITDAKVSARVEQLGLASDHKDLNPMPIGGAASYGNYFRMPEGVYKIRVIVKRKDSTRRIEALFDYRV